MSCVKDPLSGSNRSSRRIMRELSKSESNVVGGGGGGGGGGRGGRGKGSFKASFKSGRERSIFRRVQPSDSTDSTNGSSSGGTGLGLHRKVVTGDWVHEKSRNADDILRRMQFQDRTKRPTQIAKLRAAEVSARRGLGC